jgi:signal peptidase I
MRASTMDTAKETAKEPAKEATKESAKESAKPRRGLDRWLIYGGLAILVVVGAGLMLTSAPTGSGGGGSGMPVRSFSFPSTSMEPTLRLGERAFANMRAYDGDAPARGDIVILTLPQDRSAEYVKRIVGLPGETVQMQNGILHIDGKPVPTVDAGTYKIASDGEAAKEAPLKRETLPNGVGYLTIDLVKNGFYDNTPPYQVPQGHYFVLGDNRDNSRDSRMLTQFGYIPRANVIGQVSWIFWSPEFSRIGTIPE